MDKLTSYLMVYVFSGFLALYIYRLLNVYLRHIYTYTSFMGRKISIFFDKKGTAATLFFGGLLHKEGKLAKVTGCFLFGVFLSRPGCCVLFF